MVSLPEDTYNDLKCSKCTFYLSVPPIMSSCNAENENEYICGRCNGEGDLRRVDIYEKVAKTLMFPCSFKTDGCQQEIDWNNVAIHENFCTERSYKCIFCEWKGKCRDMKNHCLDLHPEKILKLDDWLPLIRNDCDLMFVENNSVFNLHGTFSDDDDDDESLYSFKILYYGNASTLNFTYNIHLKLNQTVLIYFNNKISSQIFDKDDSAITTFNLNSLKDILGDGEINFKISLNKHKVNHPFMRSDSILREMECQVCKEYMQPPIGLCSTGHSICDNCIHSVNNCPMCRCELTNGRNYILENISELNSFACSNQRLGCNEFGSLNFLKEHERSCPFEPPAEPSVGLA